MKSKNQPNKSSALWFGFALGAVGGATVAYFFGTKRGRKLLKQMLDLTENLDDNLAEVIEELGEETEKGLKKRLTT